MKNDDDMLDDITNVEGSEIESITEYNPSDDESDCSDSEAEVPKSSSKSISDGTIFLIF